MTPRPRSPPRDTSASRTRRGPRRRGPGGRRRARRGALARPLGESRATRVVEGGRGSAWRVELGGQPVVVRHYRRGGWMAPSSTIATSIGRRVRSPSSRSASRCARPACRPRVLAAAVYPARPGYRADLVTEWLSPGLDLEEPPVPGSTRTPRPRRRDGRPHGRARARRGARPPGPETPQPLPAAARRTRRLGRRAPRSGPRAHRPGRPPSGGDQKNLERFRRSLEKERRGPRELGAGGRGGVPARLRSCLTASEPRSSSSAIGDIVHAPSRRLAQGRRARPRDRVGDPARPRRDRRPPSGRRPAVDARSRSRVAAPTASSPARSTVAASIS